MTAALPLILVVDDDARIREATVSALEDLGFMTISAPDGLAGLAAIQSDPSIDMVVSDVLMPSMSGPEMMQAAQEFRCDLPFVFMSGDTGCFEQGDFAGYPLLCKPFTLPALANAVEAALLPSKTTAI